MRACLKNCPARASDRISSSVGEEYSESVASHSNVSIKLLIDKSAILQFKGIALVTWILIPKENKVLCERLFAVL
jgi:hypothetical protein